MAEKANSAGGHPGSGVLIFGYLKTTRPEQKITAPADMDNRENNSGLIIDSLSERAPPETADRYGVTYSFEGLSAEQQDTMADMKRWLVFELILIYT